SAGIVRDEKAALSADNPSVSEDSAPENPGEATEPVPDEPSALPSNATARGGTPDRTAPSDNPVRRPVRPGRWRAPAQWAALAALVAVLVIANHLQRSSNDEPETALPPDGPAQGQQSLAPTEPAPFPTGATTTPTEARPTPPPSTPASPAPQPSRPRDGKAAPRAGKAGIVAATSERLYRITGDAKTEEYTGKAGGWKAIREGTERIFTSPTTLYATDNRTGHIEQYDPASGKWTRIGGPGSYFAATADHLYGVGTEGIMEYSGTPGLWHNVRNTPGRIFASPTTLYATDGPTGDIAEYDPSTGWTKIGGPGSSFAATAGHLYGVSPTHHATYEYSGTPGVWHRVRGTTDRIFTSATTLYATDTANGQLQEYNRATKTWTVIGGPVSSLAATTGHLYTVSTDLTHVTEYADTPGTWTTINKP
ncbi:hypothetical protein ACFW7M_36585, partial [Streptomyces sp. NPDC058739]